MRAGGIAQALLGDLLRWWWTSRPRAWTRRSGCGSALLAGLAGDRTVLLSTHIVEDVAQTCRHAAVMAAGRVLYTGAVADLARQGEGATWEVTLPAGSPPPEGVVVSAVGSGDGTRYRVVTQVRPGPDATPVTPTLEDGYVALMRHASPLPARRASPCAA